MFRTRGQRRPDGERQQRSRVRCCCSGEPTIARRRSGWHTATAADRRPRDSRRVAAQGSLICYTGTGAHLCAFKIRSWLAAQCRCVSLWLSASRSLAAAQAYLVWRRAARVPALLSAGRLRARPVSAVDAAFDRLTDPAFWLSIGVLVARLSMCRCGRGRAIRRRRWSAGCAAARSAPLGKDPAQADVARHARAGRGDGLGIGAVDRVRAARGRRPALRRRSSTSAAVFAAAAACCSSGQRSASRRTSAHVQRGYEADAHRRVADGRTPSSSASRAATARAARKRCSRTSCSSRRRRWRRRAASTRSWA